MVMFMEKKIGRVGHIHLPGTVQKALGKLNNIRAKLFEARHASPEDLKHQAEQATETLQQEVRQNLASPQIAWRVQKGATHFHIGKTGTGLHFVKLPEKHRGKKYEPLIGYT